MHKRKLRTVCCNYGLFFRGHFVDTLIIPMWNYQCLWGIAWTLWNDIKMASNPVKSRLEADAEDGT